MKVESPAGDFEIKLKEARVEGGHIVIRGELGVWDSNIYMTPGDLLKVVSIVMRPSVLWFLLKLPFERIFGGPREAEKG